METTPKLLCTEATKPLSVVAPDMLRTYRSIQSQACIGSSEVNMADGTHKDWRELCVAVTNEKDSRKLVLLIQELIEALDRGERNWRHPSSPHDTIDTHRQESRVGTVCVSA
jgi:hypothetical protein